MEQMRVEIPLAQLTCCKDVAEWREVLRHFGFPLEAKGVHVDWVDVQRQVHVFEYHPAQGEQ
jgi:hypothetical protein